MIETARLRLRPPVEADRAALRAIWADPLIMADLGRVKSAAESDATLARHAGYGGGLGFHAVIRRSDAAVVGFCGLKPGAPQTPVADEIEAGWIIARDCWRRGYAAEAMRAVLAWGWAHLAAPRVVAITARRNAKSRGLMERLGMRHALALDFTHPLLASDDPLADCVTYVIERPE